MAKYQTFTPGEYFDWEQPMEERCVKTMDRDTFGTVEPGKKALILYATITGNSERIADAFRRVLEHYGFQVDVYKAVDAKHFVPIQGYDLYVVGTGIVSGLPERNLLAAFGAGNYTAMKQLAEIGGDTGAPQWGRDGKIAKGVTFLTYGGSRRGPSEIIASESLLEMMMEEMGIQVMGKFACPGSIHRNETHNQVDGLAKTLSLPVEQAAQLLYAYKTDPEGETARSWSPEVLAAVRTAAGAVQKVDMRLMGMPRSWHNQAADRPSERDIVKAEIFMAEFIEDVFIPREDASIDSCYICRC